MTLLRRRPREVYRVYTEQEYLRGDELDLELATGREWPPAAACAKPSSGSLRVRRVVVAMTLTAALGTVGGAIVHNSSLFSSHRRVGRGPGHLVAATRSLPTRPPVVGHSHAKLVQRVVVRARASSRGKTAIGAPAEGGAAARTPTVIDAATVTDVAAAKHAATVESSATTAGTATTENISVDRPPDVTTAHTEPTPAPPSTRKNQGEFGFER